MKNIINKSLASIILSLVLLTGCVGSIDTLNKRFAAFEISYKATLEQVYSMEAAGSFKPETRLKLSEALTKVYRARAVAYAAKDSGDVLAAQDQLSLAIVLLDQLKLLLPAGGQI